MTIGLPSQIVLPIIRADFARCAFRLKEPPRGVHRAIHRQPVLHADDVILLAMPRCGMDRAGALFQRHVVAQNAHRITVHERMPENGPSSLLPWKRASTRRLAPAAFRRRRCQQFRGHDIHVAVHVDGRHIQISDDRRLPGWRAASMA